MLLEVLQRLQGKESLKKAKKKKSPRERNSFKKSYSKIRTPHDQQNPRATTNGERWVKELQASFTL